MKLNLAARASALAFVTAFVTLFMQILVHRMVSAKLLNNYAFLVISLTMLGFAFSGVILSRWLPWFLKHLEEIVPVLAAGFVLSAIGVSAVFYHADVASQFATTRSEFVMALTRAIPFSLLYAVPFAFCGFILGTLLAAPDLPVHRIYCFDLLGSALGAFAVIPAITYWGVETSALAACALLLAGAFLFAVPRARLVRAVGAAAALVLVLCLAYSDKVFDMKYPRQSMLGAAQQLVSGRIIEYTAWDPVAHIEVLRLLRPLNPNTSVFPSLHGANADFLGRFNLMLTQNNIAFTYAVAYDGTKRSLKGIEETIYAAAYQTTSVSRPRVLVIGVGGGFDVLNALAFDARDITAVEVNGATMRILTDRYRDYFRQWVQDPKVRLVHEEGRHFIATTDGPYDVIQLSGVDSYSGTPGAAHVFSENYLYTAEAFDLYLSRLSHDGILNMMRLEFLQPREMLRALITAVEALRRAGVERPADHTMTVTQSDGRFTALLVKKTPFTEAEQQRLQSWTSGNRFFKVSAAPHLNARHANLYQVFLSLQDPHMEAGFLALYPFDVSPVDDNRPFFFRYSQWWHLLSGDSMVSQSIPFVEYTVILLAMIAGIVAVLCIYVPLRYLAGRQIHSAHSARYAVYFAGAGLGFLAIEIGLLQKFGLFLGHPNYALSVVLAALLLAAGLGSLFSNAIVRILRNVRFVSYALATVLFLEYGLIFPLLPKLIGLPFWLKTTMVFAFVCPIGVCLGTFLPFGVDRLKRTIPGFVPWAWGINGIFSVLAPILSVAFSITWGINALLLAAIPIYLAVGLSMPESR